MSKWLETRLHGSLSAASGCFRIKKRLVLDKAFVGDFAPRLDVFEGLVIGCQEERQRQDLADLRVRENINRSRGEVAPRPRGEEARETN